MCVSTAWLTVRETFPHLENSFLYIDTHHSAPAILAPPGLRALSNRSPNNQAEGGGGRRRHLKTVPGVSVKPNTPVASRAGIFIYSKFTW